MKNGYVSAGIRALACLAIGTAAAADRPLPRPALAERLKDPVEVLGIVHYSLNTYTGRQWGYGDEDPALFNPARFDADQIVGACKAGGLKGLVMVAKHHDGFCLWPTKTTAHNISKSPFRGGKGDYVREMYEACARAGLKYGFYCSPWDRNNAAYATEEYVKTYWAQVLELFNNYGRPYEMWFDGANGGDGYYGGRREKRKIPKGYYRFEQLIAKVRETQPQVCVFYDYSIGDFHYPGNESGDLSPKARATYRDPEEPATPGWERPLFTGDINGRHFSQPECDMPLRAQWFWDPLHDGLTKSPAYLMKCYLRTVGNGGTLDLGIAPTKDGVLSDEDVAALKGFGDMQKAFFAQPAGAAIVAAGGGACVAPGAFNVIVMQEDISAGEQIDGWAFASPAGTVLSEGVSIGIKRIRVLKEVCPAGTYALRVTKHAGAPRPVKVAFYRVPAALLAQIEAAKCPQRALPAMNRAAFHSKDGQTITYRYPTSVAFSKLYFIPDRATVAATPLKCAFSFSEDGVTWTPCAKEFDLFEKGNPLADPSPVLLDFGTPVKATWIRLEAHGIASKKFKVPSCGGLAVPRGK